MAIGKVYGASLKASSHKKLMLAEARSGKIGAAAGGYQQAAGEFQKQQKIHRKTTLSPSPSVGKKAPSIVLGITPRAGGMRKAPAMSNISQPADRTGSKLEFARNKSRHEYGLQTNRSKTIDAGKTDFLGRPDAATSKAAAEHKARAADVLQRAAQADTEWKARRAEEKEAQRKVFKERLTNYNKLADHAAKLSKSASTPQQHEAARVAHVAALALEQSLETGQDTEHDHREAIKRHEVHAMAESAKPGTTVASQAWGARQQAETASDNAERMTQQTQLGNHRYGAEHVDAHNEAARLHAEAAKHHQSLGNEAAIAKHLRKSKSHNEMASEMSAGIAKARAEIAAGAKKVAAELASMKTQSRESLEAEYKRSHRVSDTREMSKGDLQYAIARGRHGQAAIDAHMRTTTGTKLPVPIGPSDALLASKQREKRNLAKAAGDARAEGLDRLRPNNPEAMARSPSEHTAAKAPQEAPGSASAAKHKAITKTGTSKSGKMFIEIEGRKYYGKYAAIMLARRQGKK